MSPEAALIYLVDDEPAVLKALSRLLRSAGFQVLAFNSAPEFLAQYRPEAPACLVLDLSMPGFSGLELQQWLAQLHDPLPVIFLSAHGDVPATARAMKAGAVDFLTKPVNDQNLLAAIHEALRRGLEARARFAETAWFQQRLATLTPREHEVLVHVVTGELNKQIAGILGTAEKTIKVHRSRVMEKMGVHSLAELVRLAERSGLGISRNAVPVNQPLPASSMPAKPANRSTV
jgi:FixJ family two-component response regulator